MLDVRRLRHPKVPRLRECQVTPQLRSTRSTTVHSACESPYVFVNNRSHEDQAARSCFGQEAYRSCRTKNNRARYGMSSEIMATHSTYPQSALKNAWLVASQAGRRYSASAS